MSSNETTLVYHLDTQKNNINKVTLSGGQTIMWKIGIELWTVHVLWYLSQ